MTQAQLQALLDALFGSFEKAFARRPIILAALEGIQGTVIDGPGLALLYNELVVLGIIPKPPAG